jgi:hypothetical protein
MAQLVCGGGADDLLLVPHNFSAQRPQRWCLFDGPRSAIRAEHFQARGKLFHSNATGDAQAEFAAAGRIEQREFSPRVGKPDFIRDAADQR